VHATANRVQLICCPNVCYIIFICLIVSLRTHSPTSLSLDIAFHKMRRLVNSSTLQSAIIFLLSRMTTSHSNSTQRPRSKCQGYRLGGRATLLPPDVEFEIEPILDDSVDAIICSSMDPMALTREEIMPLSTTPPSDVSDRQRRMQQMAWTRRKDATAKT